MRIGISATWLSTEANARNSGLSRYAFNLIDQASVVAPQHEFVVFAPVSFDVPVAWGCRPNLEVLTVTPTILARRVLWEHLAARGLASRHGLDVWFSAAQVIPLRSPIPTSVMVHDVIPLLFPEHHVHRTVLYYRWALRHAARRADRVLTNSECTKRDFVKMFGIDSARVVVTPLGPGNLALPEPGAFERLGVREPYLLALGSLEWRKNLHGLVDAFSEVAKLRPEYNLAIVGAKRLTAGNLVRTRITELGLEDRVQLLGYAPDAALPDLFRRSAAFVFPSFYEGFGLPVLEALLNNTVVACTDRSSVPEVAGDHAFYFDPESKDSMLEAIVSAIDAPDREARAAAGRAFAETFTWDRTARETVAVLEAIV